MKSTSLRNESYRCPTPARMLYLIAVVLFGATEGNLLNGAGNPLVFAREAVTTWLHEWSEELKYRKVSIEQYREQISKSFAVSLDRFDRDRETASNRAQQELEAYLSKFDRLYEESNYALKKQQAAIDELNQRRSIRSPRLDDSLEQFRKFYNETASTFLQTPKYIEASKRKKKRRPTSHVTERLAENSLDRQISKLSDRLKSEWDSVRLSAKEGVNTAENAVRSALLDMTRFQDDLVSNARSFVSASQFSIQSTIDKRTARQELQILQKKLKELEKDGTVWVESAASAQKKFLDGALKTLQERIVTVNSQFEELLMKRSASMQYTAENDATLNKVLNLIDPSCPGWQHIKSDDGYEVYRRFSSGDGSRYACVKCHGVINSSAKDVLELFEDNSRVQEYNSFCVACRDVEYVSDDTKITWACSPPVFPMKARDFCTVVHIRKLRDGTFVILNRATEHPDAPTSSDYVRAQIVLAANIIQPLPGDPRKCKLTMISQVDPGGFSPPVLVNHVCTLGPPGFLRNVEVASKRKPSKKVLQEKKKLAEQRQLGMKNK